MGVYRKEGPPARVHGPNLLHFYEEEVLPRLGVEAVYGQVAFKTRRGRYWRGPCPLHGGDNPTAFSVDTETLGWTCFSHCGNGSVLAFINGGPTPRGQDFVLALRRLTDLAGLPFPEREPSPEEIRKAEEQDRRQSLLELFQGYAHTELLSPEGKPAWRYLTEKRGFLPSEIDELPVGFYPSPEKVESWLLKAGFKSMEIEASGLTTNTEGKPLSSWSGRLVGSWRDHTKKIVTFFARDLSGRTDQSAKYLYLRGSKKPPAYGLDVALKTSAGREDLVLVEGLLDVLFLHARGFPNVAALGGNGRLLTEERWEELRRLGIRRLTLVLDNDQAGREGLLAALENALLADPRPDIRVVDPGELGEAKDPDELARSQGLEAWHTLLAKHRSLIQSLGSAHLGEITPESSLEERRSAAERIGKILPKMTEPLDREELIELAAGRTGFGTDAFHELVQKQKPTTSKSQEKTEDVPVDLAKLAPLLSDVYGLEELERDQTRELVSLSHLPSWPNGPTTGHGWGETMDRVLGGGVCPGYFLVVGASHAGAGKTAFVMQIADGLTLRNVEILRKEERGPITPVVLLSEMSASALTWRTLARWTGEDSRTFRAGGSALRILDRSDAEERVDRAFRAGREALRGPLGIARTYCRILSGVSVKEPIEALKHVCGSWREELTREHPNREVWPVVVLDPIQRWQDPGKSEVEALNELVENLGALANEEGWVVLATSDTNKPGATDRNDGGNALRERATAAIRGSYKLLHLADAALFLAPAKKEKEEQREGEIEAWVVKNRWGVSIPNDAAKIKYHWYVRTARFEPIEDEDGSGRSHVLRRPRWGGTR